MTGGGHDDDYETDMDFWGEEEDPGVNNVRIGLALLVFVHAGSLELTKSATDNRHTAYPILR